MASFPQLHPDMIEQVRERVEIQDVVSDYVVLKKSGKGLIGLCPFHKEKTPSFSVTPANKAYYCFGCNEGGDPIKFLIKLNNSNFREVVLNLAERYNIPIKTLEPDKTDELNKILVEKKTNYQLMVDAQDFFVKSLIRSEKAFNYIKERGIPPEIIKEYGLGYCPSGELLVNYLLKKKYNSELLISVGLAAEHEGRLRAFLGDRLIIPIHDTQGRVIAFSGRSLDPNVKGNKYVNTKESLIFSKKNQVYGLDKAAKAIKEADEAILVEGYFDAIALHAAGVKNTVAVMGTAISPEQIRLICRYTPSAKIVLNLDADSAGVEAVNRALEKIQPLTLECLTRILQIPTFYKDADNLLVKRGVAFYRELLESAPLWIQWKIDGYISEIKVNRDNLPIHRKLEAFVKTLTGTTRIMYAEYAATALDLQPEARSYFVRNILGGRVEPETKERKTQPSNSVVTEAEKTLLWLLLNRYEIFTQFVPIISDLCDLGIQFSISLHQQIWENIKLLNPKDYTINNFSQARASVYQACLEQCDAPYDIFYGEHLNCVKNPCLLANRAIAEMELVMQTSQVESYSESWEKAIIADNEPEAMKYAYLLEASTKRINKLKKFLRNC